MVHTYVQTKISVYIGKKFQANLNFIARLCLSSMETEEKIIVMGVHTSPPGTPWVGAGGLGAQNSVLALAT